MSIELVATNRNDRLRAELAAIDQEVDRAPAATRRLQRYLPIAVAVVAVGSFSAVTWYAYNQGVLEGSEVAAPLIKPKGPLKIAPDSPGGVDVPNRDKFIYSQLENREGDDSKVERLLPPPEQPKEPPQPVQAAPATANDAFKRAAELAARGAPPPLPTPETAAEAGQAGTDESGQQTAQAQQAQAQQEGPIRLTPKSEGQRASPPPQPPAAAGPKRSPAMVAPPDPKASAPAPVKPTAAPKPPTPQQATPQQAAPRTAAKGAFIQLGALRSTTDAERAWQTAQARNSDLLAGLRLDVERAEIPGKGVFYRVQAGPVRDAAAAKELCDALQQRKQGCFVVHRR